MLLLLSCYYPHSLMSYYISDKSSKTNTFVRTKYDLYVSIYFYVFLLIYIYFCDILRSYEEGEERNEKY